MQEFRHWALNKQHSAKFPEIRLNIDWKEVYSQSDAQDAYKHIYNKPYTVGSLTKTYH